jgi:hypothetical protein
MGMNLKDGLGPEFTGLIITAFAVMAMIIISLFVMFALAAASATIEQQGEVTATAPAHAQAEAVLPKRKLSCPSAPATN